MGIGHSPFPRPYHHWREAYPLPTPYSQVPTTPQLHAEGVTLTPSALGLGTSVA